MVCRGFLFEEWEIEIGFETLGLPSKVIAVHSDVEPANQFLAPFLYPIGRFSEQDQAGAGAPGGSAKNPFNGLSAQASSGRRGE